MIEVAVTLGVVLVVIVVIVLGVLAWNRRQDGDDGVEIKPVGLTDYQVAEQVKSYFERHPARDNQDFRDMR